MCKNERRMQTRRKQRLRIAWIVCNVWMDLHFFCSFVEMLSILLLFYCWFIAWFIGFNSELVLSFSVWLQRSSQWKSKKRKYYLYFWFSFHISFQFCSHSLQKRPKIWHKLHLNVTFGSYLLVIIYYLNEP